VQSTTTEINPCHGFSLIAGVVDTGDKFIAGDKKKHAMEGGTANDDIFLLFYHLFLFYDF
jgi:hypothetical protein